MTHRYADIAFTPQVRAVQENLGSRKSYVRMDEGEVRGHVLEQDEIDFIAVRDSVYLATIGTTGWPYVQHRGGPVGFVRTLDEKTIGFADFRATGSTSASATWRPTTGCRCSSWTTPIGADSNCSAGQA